MYGELNKRLIFVFILLLLPGFIKAQSRQWKLEFAYGSTIGFARTGGKFSQQYSDLAYLKISPGISQNLYSSANSGLAPFEQFLYGSLFSLGLNRRISPDWYIHSGLEMGGIGYTVTEYPTEHGRTPDNAFTLTYANRAQHYLLQTSLPIRFRYKKHNTSGWIPGIMMGVAFNYAYAPEFRNLFYQGSPISKGFITTDFGLRLEIGSLISFNLIYQQGYFPVVNDEVHLLSSNYLNRGTEHFLVKSNVSNVRLSVAVNLVKLPFRKEDSSPLKRKASHVLSWDCTDSLRIILLDDDLEDGDSVAVFLDDKIIHSGLLLDKTGYSLVIPCDTINHTLHIVPLNEGRISPNTVRVLLYSRGVLMQDEVLKSNPKSQIILQIHPRKLKE